LTRNKCVRKRFAISAVDSTTSGGEVAVRNRTRARVIKPAQSFGAVHPMKCPADDNHPEGAERGPELLGARLAEFDPSRAFARQCRCSTQHLGFGIDRDD
jgi:hypothetical protein